MTFSDVDGGGDPVGRKWVAARLRALRAESGLSQQKLADKAGIAREIYNALENARPARTMTMTYATPIAKALTKVLGRDVESVELLPPGSVADAPGDPLALLQGLSGAVDGLKQTIEELEARVSHLERGRGAGGSRRAGTRP